MIQKLKGIMARVNKLQFPRKIALTMLFRAVVRSLFLETADDDINAALCASLRIACDAAGRAIAREKFVELAAIDVASYVGKLAGGEALAINEDFIRDNIAVASAALVDRRATRVPGFFIGRSRGINWRELIKRHKLDAAR